MKSHWKHHIKIFIFIGFIMTLLIAGSGSMQPDALAGDTVVQEAKPEATLGGDTVVQEGKPLFPEVIKKKLKIGRNKPRARLTTMTFKAFGV